MLMQQNEWKKKHLTEEEHQIAFARLFFSILLCKINSYAYFCIFIHIHITYTTRINEGLSWSIWFGDFIFFSSACFVSGNNDITIKKWEKMCATRTLSKMCSIIDDKWFECDAHYGFLKLCHFFYFLFFNSILCLSSTCRFQYAKLW